MNEGMGVISDTAPGLELPIPDLDVVFIPCTLCTRYVLCFFFYSGSLLKFAVHTKK